MNNPVCGMIHVETNKEIPMAEKAHADIHRARRRFLRNGTLMLAAGTLSPASLWAGEVNADAKQDELCIGLITDMHYADKPPTGNRYYRQTLDKLDEAGDAFSRAAPHFIVELGDLIDAADSVDTEKRYLETVNRPFAELCEDRHYVLGNHCVDTLRKDEFLGAVGQPESYYSFDRAGYHFVVLDACFRHDGVPYGRKNSKWTDANIPPEELQWLAADLRSTDRPTIIFAHQRLDVSTHHGVRNNAAVRKLLENSGNVLAVFQGHSHKNDLNEIAGIHYCTLAAMIEGSGAENNGYSLMRISRSGTIQIEGFRTQADYDWSS